MPRKWEGREAMASVVPGGLARVAERADNIYYISKVLSYFLHMAEYLENS
jgi:hypothetical protein